MGAERKRRAKPKVAAKDDDGAEDDEFEADLAELVERLLRRSRPAPRRSRPVPTEEAEDEAETGVEPVVAAEDSQVAEIAEAAVITETAEADPREPEEQAAEQVAKDSARRVRVLTVVSAALAAWVVNGAPRVIYSGTQTDTDLQGNPLPATGTTAPPSPAPSPTPSK